MEIQAQTQTQTNSMHGGREVPGARKRCQGGLGQRKSSELGGVSAFDTQGTVTATWLVGGCRGGALS